MKLKLVFILLLSVLVSCKKASTVSFSSENFSESELQICENDPCSKIDIDYIIASGNKEVTENINTKIETYIISKLFLGEDEQPSAKTIKEAANQFVIAYRDHKNEFEYNLEYEAEISVSKVFENTNLTSLQFQSYLYTGGAHGYGSTEFKNFDLHTGKEINTSDLFNDYNGFLKLVETEFRKEFKIPEEESINYNGFWFDDDIFYLPESIGFLKKELLFIYNQYDIASYAEGPIVFSISKKKATPFIKKEFL